MRVEYVVARDNDDEKTINREPGRPDWVNLKCIGDWWWYGHRLDDSEGTGRIQMDVTNKASIANAVQQIEEADGKLNVLVNKLFEQTSEDWDAVARTNVAASFFATTAFLGLLAKAELGVLRIRLLEGRIIAFYVFAADMSLKRAPVRVNGIYPGPFPSQFSTEAPARNLEQLLQTHFLGSPIPPPLRRAGREEEIAALAVYLAPDKTSLSTAVSPW
ncbi:hypothetical protein ACEPAI_3844 [Sanghuangporus weigelae]